MRELNAACVKCVCVRACDTFSGQRPLKGTDRAR
jgi:hypothetical protein